MSKDKKMISKFIKDVRNNSFKEAKNSLKKVLDEKMKQRENQIAQKQK